MKEYKPFLIYGFSIVFNAIISFITFFLLTHYLNEVDYGIINLYNSFIIFLSPFIAIGVQYTLGVDYFKLNEKSFREHFTNAVIMLVVTCLFFTILLIPFSGMVQKFIGTNLFFTVTIPLACLITIIFDIFLNLFRNKERHFLFAGFSMFKSILEVSLTILLVIILGFSWEGRLGSYLLTLFVILIIAIYFIKKWKLFTRRINKSGIAKIFYNGLPFVPERLSIFILGYSDRFFINYFEGIGDVGFYSAGAQMAVMVSLAILTLCNTFYPQIFRLLSQEKPDYKKLKKIILYFIGISALVTVGVIICIPLFFKLFVGPAFQLGKKYALLLTLGMLFWSIYNAFIPFLLNLKKNKLIMVISIIGMMVSLLSNYFMVKFQGALGAAITSIVVYFLMAALVVFWVHKYYGLNKILISGDSSGSE
jgi:O-antigen/teichoic acid export membrane protein